MYHYKVALPLKLSQLYTYKSASKIQRGTRAVVPFRNTIVTGIVIEKDKHIEPTIKYREIYEIVDEKPIITEELLKLAEWIERYYFSPLGQNLNAMLPSALNVQIQLEVRKNNNHKLTDLNEYEKRILDTLDDQAWVKVSRLKDELKATKIYSILENLEDREFIEIKRVYDQKIKKKFANYITVKKCNEIPKLTEKQQQCFDDIKLIGFNVPLARLADKYSYAIIKALRNKGLISIDPVEVRESKQFNNIKAKKVDFELTDEQKDVVVKLQRSIKDHKFNTFLLHGITGSGKTEVYIKTIEESLTQGRAALMLVPEIALTPQMVARLFGAFGKKIAILHSRLNDRERWEQWKKISRGESVIVVGARSAIFAPLRNIGVIIVDEEHETSYKQDSTPRYNGRDLAILRARLDNSTCILGSATPSLESWNNVKLGKFKILSLTKRPILTVLPAVKILDMKNEEDKESYFSKYLLDKIKEKISRKEQVILFQNRRGHSSFVQCMSCGEVFQCKDCDISMSYHSHTEELICHYCGRKSTMARKCSKCGSYHFVFGSPGTQQIEKSLKIIFPEARIKRMDSDSARKKDSYDAMYDMMNAGFIDILLGTQMIAKGLDFPNVTLVGVISADISLNIPDFRAAERTFQLLTQVAGRSGRGEKQGEVIIQTYNPDHYAIKYALMHDYQNFSAKEFTYRKQLKYPPYWKIGRLLFTHKSESMLKKNLFGNSRILIFLTKEFPGKIIIMGPISAPIPKIKNLFRYHIIIKAENNDVLNSSIRYLQANLKLISTIKFVIDIDPLSLL